MVGSGKPRSSQAWSRRTAITAATAATTATALGTTAAARPRTGQRGHGDQTANGRLYEIRSGRHRVVVAGVAATLLSWRVDGTEMLLTHQPHDVGEGYQGKTILPWPNRIDHGRYTFDGRQLQVPINEPSRDCALHGLMNFVEWLPVHHTSDEVTLEHHLHPHYGYPFAMAFRITYRVDEHGVRCTLTARNAGDTDAPLGTANHTYIAAGSGTIDSMTLQVPASTYYVTNDRLIPTGTAPVAGTEYDFRSPRRVGSTVMDTAFTDLARDRHGRAIVRFGRADGTEVLLWVDETYDYLQIYTDDAPSADRAQPPRSGITVEPNSCPPNAFVTGEGVIVLPAGHRHRASWGYQIIQ